MRYNSNKNYEDLLLCHSSHEASFDSHHTVFLSSSFAWCVSIAPFDTFPCFSTSPLKVFSSNFETWTNSLSSFVTISEPNFAGAGCSSLELLHFALHRVANIRKLVDCSLFSRPNSFRNGISSSFEPISSVTKDA